MKESYLQNRIKSYLTFEGFLVVKQETGGGIPDLLVCKNSRHIWIEVKTKTGTVTEIQKACHRYLKSKHEEVFICRSKEDVCYALETCQAFNEKPQT